MSQVPFGSLPEADRPGKGTDAQAYGEGKALDNEGISTSKMPSVPSSPSRTPTASGMVIPVAGVTIADLNDGFGDPRSGGRKHAGIDIMADRGTAVLAAVSGKVVTAGDSGNMGGRRVWIEGDDGRAYYYAHLDTIGVTVGQRVPAGATIGTVGTTGNAAGTRPHLHFSINGAVGNENPVANPFVELTGNGRAVYAAAGGSSGALSGPTLRQGSSGSSVGRLQEWLNDNGYNAGAVDNQFGPKTAAAVRRLQQAKGIEVDGIVGPQTYSVMSLGVGAGGEGSTVQGGIEETVRQLYGYSAWALDHPEIGKILREAASEEWSTARLQGAISRTKWWKRTELSMRQWEALRGEDPAQARALVEDNKFQIRLMAQQMGVEIPDGRLQRMATDAERFAWSQAELRNAIGAEAKYKPNATLKGDLGSNAAMIRQIAADHVVPMTDRAVFNLAQDMTQGRADQDNVISRVIGLAKQRYPHLSRQIDDGTLPDLAAGLRTEAAQLLEVDPSQIDLIRDKKFSRLLSVTGDDGRRAMSIPEAQTYVRGLPEWRYTSTANEQAAGIATNLLSTFGEIA